MTEILAAVSSGDGAARERLMEMTYGELRDMAVGLMKQERQGHTLQPTALVHEAILKFFKNSDVPKMPNRAYFYGAMAQGMRRILVDHARRRKAHKRGGDMHRLPLDETIRQVEKKTGFDVIELDEVLGQLEQLDARTSQVVALRCFAGFENKEIAKQLDLSLSTIDREWRFARAWLKKKLEESDG